MVLRDRSRELSRIITLGTRRKDFALFKVLDMGSGQKSGPGEMLDFQGAPCQSSVFPAKLLIQFLPVTTELQELVPGFCRAHSAPNFKEMHTTAAWNGSG